MSVEGNQAWKEIKGNFPTDGRETTKAEDEHIYGVCATKTEHFEIQQFKQIISQEIK
jgi:hypothetical protein